MTITRADALDLADQTVTDPVTDEIVAGVESAGRIEPGATRQDVGYLSDPAIGGVRLEDLVLVTDDGCEVLTRFPYDLEV